MGAIGFISILAIGHVHVAGYVPSPGTSYVHADHRGDVVAASDGGGHLVHRHEHRPWGGQGARTRGAPAVRRAFDHWEHDRAAGLMYARARHYDRGLARFVSIDPAGQAGYAALAAAPLGHTDPGGRKWYRILAADGSPAFRLNQAKGIYEQIVPDAKLVSSRGRAKGGKYLRLRADDVWIPHWQDRPAGTSLFRGWRRSWLEERRNFALEIIADSGLSTENRHKLMKWRCTTVRNWRSAARRNSARRPASRANRVGSPPGLPNNGAHTATTTANRSPREPGVPPAGQPSTTTSTVPVLPAIVLRSRHSPRVHDVRRQRAPGPAYRPVVVRHVASPGRPRTPPPAVSRGMGGLEDVYAPWFPR